MINPFRWLSIAVDWIDQRVDSLVGDRRRMDEQALDDANNSLKRATNDKIDRAWAENFDAGDGGGGD